MMKKSTSDEKFKLGRQYLNGEGVKQDDKQAVHWWRLAAEEGNADAQCSLGMAYWEGQGVKQDDEQAVHWFRLAAEQGDAGAQNNLGIAYWEGRGVEQDDEQAVHWCRLAAEQGIEDAKYRLALIENGSDHEPRTAEIIQFPKESDKAPSAVTSGHSNILEVQISYDDLKNKLKNEIKEELFRELKSEFSGARHDHLSIKQILEAGETRTVEYKETFSFNTRENKSGDDRLRHALLREVAAFLNTEGGVVLIGVSDDQRVTGIERDDFKDQENYVRKITQVIASSLGEVAATLTQIEIHDYDGKKICAVKCEKSSKPVYCEFKKFGQQTFVRIGNVTTEPPRKEWVDYCKYHFE